MFSPEKKIGTSLLVLGMIISGKVEAQTCVRAPTCEELGYDKAASDCGNLAKLKCPFDSSKYFCTAYTDQNGKKVAEIGDFVYTDTISAEVISGRIPVGIVFDLSGKMMSLAQFTGETASSCETYTADGVNGWQLASMENMGLIKANVDKINAQLAKIPNTTQIETNDVTECCDEGSRYWWTSDGKSACMESNKAVDGTDNGANNNFYGCNGFEQENQNEARHALCVRSFSSSGAGENVATQKTYKVGDVYTNDKGVAIGTVFSVDSSGLHGYMINRTSRAGNQTQAIEYCDSLNASTGFIWGLPSWDNMVTVCLNSISGYSTSSMYWTSNSNTTFYKTLSFCDSTSNKSNQDSTTTLPYFCATSF